MIQAGDKLPAVAIKLIDQNGVHDADSAAVLGGGRVVLFAVPGAFTPTCDVSHLPSFVTNADKMRGLGVDRILCAAANDYYVVKAWAERAEALGRVDFIADVRAQLADALGLARDFPDLGRRFRRFALIAQGGVVEQIFVEEEPGVKVSGAPAVLLALQSPRMA